MEQERELHEKLPAFDPLMTRSDRDNGILVEFLRTFPGSHVNHHVARFVCWGKQTGLFGKLAFRSQAISRLVWPENQNAKHLSKPSPTPPNSGTFGPFRLRVVFEAA
jgi:hypothetical protein